MQAILFGSVPTLLDHGHCGGFQVVVGEGVVELARPSAKNIHSMQKDFLGFRKALEKHQCVGFLLQYALKRAISHVAEG